MDNLLDRKNSLNLTPSNGKVITIEDLLLSVAPGNHIAVKCGLIWHHGIFVGNNEFIHMCGENESTAKIQKTNLQEFRGVSQDLVVIEYFQDTPQMRSLTVEIAQYLLDHDNNQPGIFNIVTRNCEMFATLCRTGNERYNLDIKQICNSIIFSIQKTNWKFIFT